MNEVEKEADVICSGSSPFNHPEEVTIRKSNPVEIISSSKNPIQKILAITMQKWGFAN